MGMRFLLLTEPFGQSFCCVQAIGTILDLTSHQAPLDKLHWQAQRLSFNS